MSDYIIHENSKRKDFVSPKYNYSFNKENGMFVRWGAEREDNPSLSPYGPEIADIEISTACSGLTGRPCSFCYKSNTPKGTYMSFETFKKVFHNLIGARVIFTLENDKEIELSPDHICKTTRGNIKASELQEDDEFLDL